MVGEAADNPHPAVQPCGLWKHGLWKHQERRPAGSGRPVLWTATFCGRRVPVSIPSAALGLARVTVNTPHRRVDVALPEQIAIAELLPELLQHAGEAFADEGERH